MTKAIKALSIIGTVFLAGAIGSGIAITVIHHTDTSGKCEAIKLTNLDNAIVTDSDLGKVNPGESKTQRFSVTSLISLNTVCMLSFNTTDAIAPYSYINLSVLIEDKEEINAPFTDYVTGNKDFHFHVATKQSKEVKIVYTLAEDIPENMLDTKLSFQVIFDATSAI